MSCDNERVEFLFSCIEANLADGMLPRDAFTDAVESMIEVYYSETIQRAKERAEEKRLIDMTDAELAQACAEAQARLHLSEKVRKIRTKLDNDSGGTD